MKKIIIGMIVLTQFGLANEVQDGYTAWMSGNDTKAEQLFKKNCTKKNNSGCAGLMDIGSAYLFGDNVDIDYIKARLLLQQSCDGGIEVGCAYIGSMYASGVGIEQNFAKAVDYAKKACNGKNKYGTGGTYHGCKLLGDLYRNGTGIEQDNDKAAKAYKKACNSGNEDACGLLSK